MSDSPYIELIDKAPNWGSEQYYIELKQQIPVNEIEVDALNSEIWQTRIKLYFSGFIIIAIIAVSTVFILYYPTIRNKLDGNISEIGTISIAFFTISVGAIKLFYNNILYYWEISSLKSQQMLAIRVAQRELQDSNFGRRMAEHHG